MQVEPDYGLAGSLSNMMETTNGTPFTVHRRCPATAGDELASTSTRSRVGPRRAGREVPQERPRLVHGPVVLPRQRPRRPRRGAGLV
jgi:hypothetical protein